MKNIKKLGLLMFIGLFLVLSFTACEGNDKTPSKLSTAILVADYGDEFEGSNKREFTLEYENKLDIKVLSDGLSSITGLDFFVKGQISDDDDEVAEVIWLDSSTLIKGLDDREFKDDFVFYDAVSLNWFMMDSIASTIRRNFPSVVFIFYSGEDGEPISFTNPEDMAADGLSVLPTNESYRGSLYYKSQGRTGYLDMPTNPVYMEDFELQGDPGEYLDATTAAQRTFDTIVEAGNIPNYDKYKVYYMTLVDLMDVDDEEAYIYICDDGEDYGAAFAFAYQSENIYTQGFGGQWVLLGSNNNSDAGDTNMDPIELDWGGRYNSVNYVLDIFNYNGSMFQFNVDDGDYIESGVANLDPNDPFVAYCGEMVFIFDGGEYLKIEGEDFAETYHRQQNHD